MPFSQHCDLEIQIKKIGKDFDFFYVTKKKDLNISISLDHQKKCIYYDKTTDVYKIRQMYLVQNNTQFMMTSIIENTILLIIFEILWKFY